MDKLRRNASVLSKVSHFCLSIGAFEIFPWEHVDGLPEDILKAAAIGKEFVQLLPKVASYVETEFVGNDKVLTEFLKTATKSYSLQFNKLCCYPITLSKIAEFSDKLQHLKLGYFPGNPQRFPRVNTKNLRKLDITYNDKGFTWDSFKSASSLRRLDFPSLKAINFAVEYNFTIDYRKFMALGYRFNYRINAPKLKTLYIDICPFTISFLSSIECLEYLETLIINIPGYGQTQMSNVCLNKSVMDLLVSYTNFVDNDELPLNISEYARVIFSIPNLAERVECFIQDISGPFDFEEIRWSAVTDLKYYRQIKLSKISKLISCFSNLRNLTVSNIKMEMAKNNEIFIPELPNGLHILAEPLSTSLQTISLKFGNYKCTDSIGKKITNYFEKRIPTLGKISIG
ncbi:hypothetical protein BX070DRAFT_236619 [Coemansia spiralis]|nr:hypothetical protein BX070DRAFT_236619 [Coemansia spiralis]